MNGIRALATALLAVLLAAAVASAQDRSRHRDFQLGASVDIVTQQSGTRSADVKTIHQRPALLRS